MLSVSAFNALLKTLEEPPAHVIFIFATTDPQKLLGTVLSRCQRFDFKNSTVEELNSHILRIAKEEDIKFETPELALQIAKQGKGSVRDALSLFDQVIALSEGQTITTESLNLSLGMVESKRVYDLLSAVLFCDEKLVKSNFADMLTENINLKMFSDQFLNTLFEIISSTSKNGELVNFPELKTPESLSLVELMWIYENLSKDIQWSLESLHPENNFSFSLLKMTVREQIINIDSQQVLKKNSEILVKEETPFEEIKIVEEPVKDETVESIPASAPEPAPETISEPEPTLPKNWSNFIKFLYTQHKSLALNLERGNLVTDPGVDMESNNYIVAFGQDCKIFFDFMNDSERRSELKEFLAEFLDRGIADVLISFQLLNDEEKEKSNFRSSLEIEEDAQKEKLDIQRNEILNSKYIKDAESLFSSKVNKVILNEEN